MRLFVDDERPAPAGWALAKNSNDALRLLGTFYATDNHVEAVSFDHDLGGTDTTRHIVLWMCSTEWWPESVYVHSGNVVGEEWLVGMVRRYAPAGTLKGYGLNYWGTGSDSVIRNEVTQ